MNFFCGNNTALCQPILSFIKRCSLEIWTFSLRFFVLLCVSGSLQLCVKFLVHTDPCTISEGPLVFPVLIISF